MKKLFFLILSFSLIAAIPMTAKKKKVHTIGDSTAANQAETGNKRGWCQMLQPFFNSDEMTVVNWAKSGASSKSFYKEASFWPTIEPQLEEGNYVLIQFAHNDEKTQGTDGDSLKAYYNSIGDASTAAGLDYRGTTPSDTYKKYLRKYIEDAKAKGAIPILVGPICRKYFKDDNGTKINAAGRHNLYQSFSTVTNNNGKYTLKTGNSLSTDDHSMDYVYQMKQVAAEYDDVPFIDLTTATKDMYESYGEPVCTSDIFCVTDASLGWTGDGTHPSPKGATLIARLFTSLLVEQAANETDPKKKAVLEGLAQYAVLSSDISFSPVSGDLGEAYSGQQLMKEFNISGFGLKPSSGKATISVDGNYFISTDKQTWTKSISMDYSAGTLITSVYVRTNISGTDPINGTLTVSTDESKSTLELTAKPVSLNGGSPFTVVWPTQNADGTTATVTGKANTTAQTLSGLELNNYATVGHKTMQHLMITSSAGAWPANEIDEVSTRYVQYQVTAPKETTLNISKISMTVAGAGGSGMCCHLAYSKDAGFGTETRFAAIEGGMTANTPQTKTTDCTVKLAEGESLYIRAYPWYNAAATSKYFCISDVTVEGMAAGETVQIEGSVTLPLHGTDVAATYFPETMAAGFANIKLSTGSNFTVNGTKTYNAGTASTGEGTVMINFKNTSGGSTATTAEAANTITFTYTPTDGFVFMPKKISVKGAKHGTSGGAWTVVASAGNNSETLVTGAAVNRSAANSALTSFDWTVSSLAATVDDPLKLNISVCNLGNGKEHSISDLVIEGLLQGAASTATKYTLNCSVSPEGAGTITIDPEMASYKEGKEVTVTATKNFGYKFVKWMEGDTQISSKATKTITMDKERNLTAVFEAVPVYTVKATATNDLEKGGLGSVTVSPDDHQGKYEEGEQITVTANESKVIKFAGWKDSFMNHDVTTATRQVTVSQDMELQAGFEVQDFIAVFNASSVQAYTYDGTPFGADITWDDNRNAKCSIVKVSDGSPVYSNDGKTVGTAGTPVVRNREGVVLAGINGLYQNGFRTSDIAWQYQFSTKGFCNVKFTGDMAAKNMAHKSYKAQYSVDGTSFTDIEGATWDMTPNVIKPVSFVLPSACDKQETVYVRIFGTGTEQLSSSYQVENQFLGLDYYSHSEAGVGNVYVLAEAEIQDDGTAPVVLSSTPVQNATGISANGTVTISYNKRIQKGSINGVVTISDGKESKTIEPVFSSKSISFPYSNLSYEKTYTVTIPAGYVESKAGVSAAAYDLSFTIMKRVKPAARTFNAIVDGSLKQLAQKDGVIPATDEMPAQYRTIQAAIDAAPSDGKTPYIIYVKNGTYRDPNFTFNSGYGTAYVDRTPSSTSTETVRIAGGINEYDSCRLVCINKPNIHIIGQSRDGVIISTDRFDGSMSWGSNTDKTKWDHSRVWYHINAGATVEVQDKGTDFHMENLTVDNENWTKLKLAGPQALCFNISADRAVMNNVRTRSYQDTYYNGGTYNRTFWNNSEIHGAVDFIYGASDVWFENCVLNINRSSGGYIVAPNHPESTRWGYVFNNTRITTDEVSDASKYSISLGRPWHEKPKTVFLHTTMELTPIDSLWSETMGGLPALWAVYDFHDAKGYAFTGAKAVSRQYYYYTDNGKKVWGKAKNSLTDAEAASYTMTNVFSGDGTTAASGYWDPTPVVEKTSKPVVSVNGNVATWSKDDYAICYVVQVNGKAVAFPTDCRYVGDEGDKITVQSVNEYGALSDISDEMTLDKATAIIAVVAEDRVRTESDATYTIDGKQANGKSTRGIIIRNGVKCIVK